MVRTITEILRANAEIVDGIHKNGTDKQSNHNYGPTYDKLFRDREVISLFMEVGISDGSCLLAWQEAFPNATIVGMDIHPCANARLVETHVGDQRSKEDCERAAAGRLFDVILEDASHRIEDTLLTLLWLWPFVKPGGMYIIEDFLHTCAPWMQQLFSLEVIWTEGPFGGKEPILVLRKPL